MTSPTPRWGPARAANRTGRYALPKDDANKMSIELPPYYNAVKMWSGSSAASESLSFPSNPVIAMDTYAPERREELNGYTYDVTRDMGKPSPDSSARGSGASSTQAQVYSRSSKIKRQGVVNGAFDLKDEAASVSSRDSSVDSMPLRLPAREEVSSAL